MSSRGGGRDALLKASNGVDKRVFVGEGAQRRSPGRPYGELSRDAGIARVPNVRSSREIATR